MAKTELLTIKGKKPYQIMKYTWVWVFISVILVGGSWYQIFSKGLNYGIDFTGGTKVIYSFKENVSDLTVRRVAQGAGLGEVQVVAMGDINATTLRYVISTKQSDKEGTVSNLTNALTEKFGADKVTLESSEVVGPKVGADLRKSAILSLVFTCILLTIYIWIRFDFHFAPGAILALVHDVSVAVGVFAFTGREFNLPILAAALTVLGYSINDTIVIFDRVRENLSRFPKSVRLTDILDISLTETMSRTIVTAITVFISVLIIFLVGGSLQDFALCLLVGTVVGVYSSVYIASPIYLLMHKIFPNKGLASLQTVQK